MSTTELATAAVAAATPQEQLNLLDHLQRRLSEQFSGSAPEFDVITDRYPGKVLQLGVIPPLPKPDPDSPETPEQFAKRLRRAPSNIGLDFEVEPRPDGTCTIAVEGRFSYYLQRYPDLASQREFYSDGQEEQTREDADETETAPAEAAAAGQDPDATSSHNGKPDTASKEKTAEVNVRLRPVFKRYIVETARIAVRLSGPVGEDVLPLDGQIAAALGAARLEPETMYPFWGRRNQTLKLEAMTGDPGDFEKAIAEAEGGSRSKPLELPQASIVVTWQPSDNGRLRVQATLRNETVVALGGHKRRNNKNDGDDEQRSLPREMDMFDTSLHVFQDVGAFKRIEFRRAPKDFRYAALRNVWAVGRNCHGRRMTVELDGDAAAEEPLTTDHWPIYLQKRMTPRRERSLQLRFDELSEEATCMQALGRITSAMKAYEGAWEQQLTDWPAESKAQCETALGDFRQDIASFERGIACLNRDPLLARAFRAANRVFSAVSADREIYTWRLFQVVYQVIHVTSLRAREQQDDDLLVELDTADVLWFPTGGGKTEAYLGLIIIALFYDRLRGKQRGLTAMLRFPLRMLSVQQLQRLLVAVAGAERYRKQMLARGEAVDGDPFALGYWAGSGNSPNSLTASFADAPFEHINGWVKHVKNAPDQGDDKRIITVCPDPACKGKVALKPDAKAVRLRHICTQCGEDVPVYISDDEVYRYLPAVVVSTVDKLAHVARAHQFVNILAGPAYRCPDHGYFTWHEPGDERDASGIPRIKDRCLARDLCTRKASEYIVVEPTKDPTPAFIVQDELHLLEEELGTFASHYDTLLRVMQERLGPGLPSKLLAATATIEAFEEQVHNLYAREARVFPSPGWKLGESFYVETDEHAVRRMYVGAAPSRPDITEFGGLAQLYLHEEIMRMQNNPHYGLSVLGMEAVHDDAWLQKLLLDYELTLGYVNTKRDADRIGNDLERFGIGEEKLRVQRLIGGGGDSGTPLAEIADTLNEIADQYDAQADRTKRLRAMVATSVISHGVDLDALNLMVVNKMTPTVAQYVQASSRAGRTHVGLVIVGFDRRSVRERAFFTYFTEYHQFLDRMIAPIPVNRFARFAAERTMPGVLSALLVQVFNRERLTNRGLDPKRALTSLAVGSELRRYISSAEWSSINGDSVLRDLAFRALGIGAQVRRRVGGGVSLEPVFSPRLTQWLEYEAGEQTDRQTAELRDPSKKGATARFFRPEPLTSFREVDEAIEFNILTKQSDIYGDLTRQS